MSVYVLMDEVDHEGDRLLGVFSTVEEAIEAARAVRKQDFGANRWAVYSQNRAWGGESQEV